MKYYKRIRESGSNTEPITKDEALRLLSGWWDEAALKDTFAKDKAFRLYTPYSYVWTETEDGLAPTAGFYGVCD